MNTATPSLPAFPHDADNGRGLGLLGVWHGVEPGFEDAFDDWYDRQHHRERVSVPGFLRARRYLNLAAGPRYFNRYDVTDVDVLASPAYLDRLNSPTAWTRSQLPHYRDTTRAVFRLGERAGEAEGGSLVTLRLPEGAITDTAGWRDELRGSLAALVADRAVLRAELWLGDSAASTLRSEEKRLRPGPDAVVAQTLLIEGSDAAHVDSAVQKRLPGLLPPATVVDRFRLVFDLRRA
jgi:hypothetical protein